MGKGIVEQGQKALKNLGKKLKKFAAKQGGVVGLILQGVGSLLETGADGLCFTRPFHSGECNNIINNNWELLWFLMNS